MSSSPATIDDLPAEMIHEVFNYLSLKDLTVCSMVNKRWQSIYSDYRVDSLVVTYTNSMSELDFSKWYNSNRRLSDSRQCTHKVFILLVNRQLLMGLKHLTFWYTPPGFDLNVLNKFSQLVHLEIHSPKTEGEAEGKAVTLNLPMLNVLLLWFPDERSSVSVDCPLLKVLAYYERYSVPEEEYRLDVKHPETIWKLETNMFGPKLAPFKKVECLVTETFQVISRNTLLSLPSLRELQFNQPIHDVFLSEYSLLFDSPDRLKELLSEFLDDLQELKGPDFRFTFAGFQMTKWALKQMDFCFQENARSIFNELVYIKNQDLIDPDASLDFITTFNYSRLMQAEREIPSWFFKRFTEIHRVETGSDKVQDPEHFRWFLSSLRTLSNLDLKNSELGHEFYDQLPTIAPQLNYLLTDKYYCRKDEQLNFDFVFKFRSLETLWIMQELPPELVSPLMTWLAERSDYGRLSFFWRWNRVRIVKSEKTFDLTKNWSLESIVKTENPDKIIEHLEKIKFYRSPSKQCLRPCLSRSVRWIRSHLVRNCFRK